MATAKQTTRPRRPKPIQATWEIPDEPDWGPLIHHVGPLLARWFMYLGGGRLPDGAFVHAYKHVITRRYVHIHDDGRCFVYQEGRKFLEVPRRRAVWAVFGDDGHYPSDEHEFEAYKGAVDAAYFLAWWKDEDEERERAGEPPFEPSPHRSLARAEDEVAEVLPFLPSDHDSAEDAAQRRG